MTSSQDMVQVCVEGSVDAHGQVSDSPLEQEADENQVNTEEKLQRKNEEDPSLTKEVTEGKVNLENSVQEQSIVGEQTKEEENGAKVNKENKQPTLIRSLLPTADGLGSGHGPGPLVTQLEDEEQLETIHLSMRSLRISDLPDLEDVDMEEFSSPQQALTPRVEVVSESTDGEAAGAPSDATSTLNPSKNSFSAGGSNKSAGLFSHSLLSFPGDEDTFVQQPKPKENQNLSINVSLIEELD